MQSLTEILRVIIHVDCASEGASLGQDTTPPGAWQVARNMVGIKKSHFTPLRSL